MSRLTRALVLAATLAAMNLVAMTTVAQAQATNDSKNARRPPMQLDPPAHRGDPRRRLRRTS
jgi:hypothetical protein